MRIVHGGSRTRLYRIWIGMRGRCSNPRYTYYPYYGGRGIRVCQEWESWVAFRDWALANGYADNLTLDRRKSDLGYSPDNCRFATRSEQVSNRRLYGRSPFKGTKRTPKGKWQAQIRIDGSTLHLGTFDRPEDAARAYDDAARMQFGEFACLNFPEAIAWPK